jgi:hypothetical protein
MNKRENMKKRIFDLTKEPENKDDKYILINSWALLCDMLSEEDENKIHDNFNKYMEDCKDKGVKYTPAYLWFLQHIKVSTI